MTTAELAQTARKITDRKKPEDDDPSLPDTTVAQKAIAAQAPEPIDVQKARTALLAGGPAAQPPQIAPPPTTSPNEDALYAQLKQMSAPPQQPTTALGQVGQMLGGVARYGWMDPAKAQALEMQRQGLMAGQRQQGIQDTMNQLKMLQEERYRQQQLQETQNLRNIQQENQRRLENRPIPVGPHGLADPGTGKPIPGTAPPPAQPEGAADIQKYNIWKTQQKEGADTSLKAFESDMAAANAKTAMPTAVGAYTNSAGKHVQIMRAPDGTLSEQTFGDVRAPNQPDYGTTVIDKNGQVIRLQPGMTAPEGYTTPQQGGSTNAAEAKNYKSASDAVKYGQDYLKSGQFTGPKDEALLEAFFEVAKPSSGFRMTQPQIDLLMRSRSWINSAEGIAYHAKTGVWFPPEQRQQIVEAMQARAESKAPAGGVPSVGGKLPNGANIISVTPYKPN